MSRTHEGTFSEEEVAELRTRFSNERVDAMVAEAEALAASAPEDDPDEDLLGTSDDVTDYSALKGDELRDLLEKRDLPTTGKNAELIERLQESDKTSDGGGQSA